MLGLPEPYGPIADGVALTAAAVLWTVLLVRIVGLRAFSKMTAFDFVATIATGSLIAQAGTRSDWPSYGQAMAAIAGVFMIQWTLAKLRQRLDAAQGALTNDPILLMEHGRILDEALETTRVARSTIFEKLRQADVTRTSQVRAVVLETTGDISVLTGGELDEALLEGVRRP